MNAKSVVFCSYSKSTTPDILFSFQVWIGEKINDLGYLLISFLAFYYCSEAGKTEKSRSEQINYSFISRQQSLAKPPCIGIMGDLKENEAQNEEINNSSKSIH